MKTSVSLEQYTRLHSALLAERAALQQRLALIKSALGDGVGDHPIAGLSTATRAAAPKAAKAVKSPKAAAPKAAAGTSSLTMREAISVALSTGPLKVRELVEAVQTAGFRFTSKDPSNSLRAYLYGKDGRRFFRSGKNGFVPTGRRG